MQQRLDEYKDVDHITAVMGLGVSRLHRKDALPVLPTKPVLDGARHYIIQRGDTVVRIAKAFDVPTSHVVTQQRTPPNPYKLYPGKNVFVLPRSSETPDIHRVVAGETLQRIAGQHRLSVEEVEAANPGVDFSAIYDGQLVALCGIDKDLMGLDVILYLLKNQSLTLFETPDSQRC